MHVLELRAFEHEPLVRRVARDEAGEILHVGIFDREIGRQFSVERGHALARRPQLAVDAVRVQQGRLDRMAAP